MNKQERKELNRTVRLYYLYFKKDKPADFANPSRYARIAGRERK